MTTLATLEQIATANRKSHHTLLRAVRQHSIEPVRIEQPEGGGRPRKLYNPADILPLVAKPPPTPTQQAIEAEKLRKLTIANDTLERVHIPRHAIDTALAGIESDTRPQIERILTQEYPAKVIGMSVDQARVYGQQTFDRICGLLQNAARRNWMH